MNGAHDMGAGHGFGAVVIEKNEPTFHAPWERDVFALALATSLHRRWNIDMSRFAREDQPPAEYLALPYYGLWLRGLERLVHATGLLDSAATPASSHDMRKQFEADSPFDRPGPLPAFSVGAAVRVRLEAKRGHTRVPRYCRGAVGHVLAQRGCHVFPDRNARAAGEDPRPLYTVRFEASALFGTAAEPHCTVMVDLWEPYLEAA